jgi:hypothetical protein
MPRNLGHCGVCTNEMTSKADYLDKAKEYTSPTILTQDYLADAWCLSGRRVRFKPLYECLQLVGTIPALQI